MDEGIWTHGSIKISHIPERQCSSQGRHSPRNPHRCYCISVKARHVWKANHLPQWLPKTCHKLIGLKLKHAGELLQGGHCVSEIAALQLYTALTTKNSRHWRGTPLSYLRQPIQMAKDDDVGFRGSVCWSRQQWWFGTAQATHAKQAGPTHQ